jgi:hypothetical protein
VISWWPVSISGCWSSPTVESRDAVVGLEGRPGLPTTVTESVEDSAVKSSVRLTSDGLRTTETICSPPYRLRLRVDPDVPGRLRVDPDVPGRSEFWASKACGNNSFTFDLDGGRSTERKVRPWLRSEDGRALAGRDKAPSVNPEIYDGTGDAALLSNVS